VEEIPISFATIASLEANVLRVPKLLVALGLASSNGEGTRKIAEGAVKIEGVVHKELVYTVAALPTALTVRLGKKAKRANLT
jgi:tyrosyl-tRNA synthetase